MRSSKVITASTLYLISLALAAANLWITAARSTIPLALDGIVTSRAVGREKHPGRDDVYWIRIGTQPSIQVDEPVYRDVAIGKRLVKSRWSRELRIDDRRLMLTWSCDFGGMMTAMPIALCIVAVTITVAIWPRLVRPGS